MYVPGNGALGFDKFGLHMLVCRYYLPLTPPTHHLQKQVKSLPFYSTHSATLLLTVYLPTTTTGMYLSNTINFT